MNHERHNETTHKWPKKWFSNGVLHRENGPAVLYKQGYQEWWRNGKLHREDGPAIISSDGTEEWFLNYKIYTFNDYVHKLQLDDAQKAALILEYGL